MRREAERSRGPLEPVGPLILKVLRGLGLERRLEEQRAVHAWDGVVGPAIAAQSRATDIRDGVLFVDVATNVWMQELGLLREGIVERLNAHLGGEVVRKIVLSIERGEPPEPTGRVEDEEPHVQ
jgi:predicted nucleic acid-binding Zn ribbon protein